MLDPNSNGANACSLHLKQLVPALGVVVFTEPWCQVCAGRMAGKQ